MFGHVSFSNVRLYIFFLNSSGFEQNALCDERFMKNLTKSVIQLFIFAFSDARMVSGSSHPYVLWNVPGRRLAMNLLQTGYCN